MTAQLLSHHRRAFRWPFVFVAFALALVSLGRSVRAEDKPPEEVARQHFADGSLSIQEGRWADAIRHFREAYRLTGVSVALYNVAIALRALGRHKEARDAFSELLEEHASTMERERRKEVRELLAEEEARLAVLNLRGLDPKVTHSVRLDGGDVADDGSRPLPIIMNPGKHAVVAERDDFHPFIWEGKLNDGQTLNLDVKFRPKDSGGTILTSPVFWVVTGAVAVVGAAIITAVILQNNAQLDPESDRSVEL